MYLPIPRRTRNQNQNHAMRELLNAHTRYGSKACKKGPTRVCSQARHKRCQQMTAVLKALTNADLKRDGILKPKTTILPLLCTRLTRRVNESSTRIVWGTSNELLRMPLPLGRNRRDPSPCRPCHNKPRAFLTFLAFLAFFFTWQIKGGVRGTECPAVCRGTRV